MSFFQKMIFHTHFLGENGILGENSKEVFADEVTRAPSA